MRCSWRSGRSCNASSASAAVRSIDANLDLIAAAYDGVVDVTAHVTALVPTGDRIMALAEVTP